MVVQFLRNFGKVLGFDVNMDVPSLSVLQEGLLNIGDSMGEVQDLLVKLVSAAVCDPGLVTGYKVRKKKRKGRKKKIVAKVLYLWLHSSQRVFDISLISIHFGVTVLMSLKDFLWPVLFLIFHERYLWALSLLFPVCIGIPCRALSHLWPSSLILYTLPSPPLSFLPPCYTLSECCHFFFQRLLSSSLHQNSLFHSYFSFTILFQAVVEVNPT